VEEAPIETRDETLFDNPQFRHYEETSNIQLFFDLFFVANLTTFTKKHEVNSLESKPAKTEYFPTTPADYGHRTQLVHWLFLYSVVHLVPGHLV
jgi:hypothetical protein